MSQESTYVTAIDPSEAVMTPAMEEIPDAPPPAAQTEVSQDDPAMRPAQRHHASYALERLRNRFRTPEGTQWINTNMLPLDGGSSQPVSAGEPMAAHEAPGRRQTISQGAALNTLMRSAARQYTPAPMLTQQPYQTPDPQQAMLGRPQMRGALRQVVRNAQQPQAMQAAAVQSPSPAAE